MRRCPLNRFEPCLGEECPFYNMKLNTCILPRLVLSQIKHNEAELKEENYERATRTT